MGTDFFTPDAVLRAMGTGVLAVDADGVIVGVRSVVNSIAVDIDSVAIDTVDAIDVMVVDSVIVDDMVVNSMAVDDVTGGANSVVMDIDSMTIDDNSVTRGADSMMVDIDPVAVGAASGGGSKGVESSGVAVMGISSNTLKLCAMELVNMIRLSKTGIQGAESWSLCNLESKAFKREQVTK